MVGVAYLDIRPKRNGRAHAPLDREILFLLAEQTSQLVAIFRHDLKPIFVNRAVRQMLMLSDDVCPAQSLAPFQAQFRPLSGDGSVVDALDRTGEWSGEILVLCDDAPDWSRTLDGRVMLIRHDARLVGYALVARERCSAIPEKVTALLTRREIDVLDALLTGGTSKAIGQQLGISHRTVEAHRGNIMRKLDAQSLPDLFKRIVTADPL